MSLKPWRVLLVDDHGILRAGLRLLLERTSEFRVVGEAETAREALEEAQRLQPDLILLDLTLPDQSGLQLLPALRQAAPKARVLVLTIHAEEAFLQEALRQGAYGYVVKSAVDQELLTALRWVAQGRKYIHPSMAEALLKSLLSEEPQRSTGELSPREEEVLRLVAQGYTNREIAERLHLSVKTVETYRARGMEKLGLQNRAQLVRYALHRGWLEP